MELLLPLLHSLDEKSYFHIIIPLVPTEERKALNEKQAAYPHLNINTVLHPAEAVKAVLKKEDSFFLTQSSLFP